MTTAVVTQTDWTRTLLTPLRAPAWRAYLYFVLVSVVAVVGVVFIFCAGLSSGLLIVTIDAPPQFVRPAGRLHTVAAALTDSNSALAQHLAITERAVEKHVSAIFTKLDLPPSQAHHRRVLAVVTYLNS